MRHSLVDGQLVDVGDKPTLVSHSMSSVLHSTMPTARPRHAITETDEITAALAVARKVWPDLADKPGALLRRLILTGRNSLVHDFAATEQARHQAIDATSGALAGVFGAGYLADLREDWPE
ncbi:hypothetical protein [Mycobacterium sp. HUMS_1102779]|uniref:hypothetical protein n=1 Tax=Mycobacterium sp. HUMS_1102779 TaxID=3383487 RepID=UPI00389993BF